MDTIADIHEEIRSARAIELPHWLKIPASVVYSSLSRSKIYALIDEGKVRSVCLRDTNAARGIRLVSRQSLDLYLSKFEKTKGQLVPGRKGRKSKAEKEA